MANEFDPTIPLAVKKLTQKDIERIQSVSPVESAFKGLAKTTTNPGIPFFATNYTAVAGTYPSFKGADTNPIVVNAEDGLVVLDFLPSEGFWTKTKVPIDVEIPPFFILSFANSTFPIVGKTQRTYEGSIWELPQGVTAQSTDLPIEGGKWISISGQDDPNVQKTLSTFLQGEDDSYIEQDVPRSAYSPNIIDNNGVVSSSAYNSIITFNALNVSKIKIAGRKFSSDSPGDDINYSTLTGELNGGGFESVLGINTSGIAPIQEYVLDITRFKNITLMQNNAYLGEANVFLKNSKEIEQDAVKKYIDYKTGSKIFNVVAYGAKGDGITDDRIAIQNTINACFAAGGGRVFFPYPDAFYWLGTQLTVASEVYGDGTSHGQGQMLIPLNRDTTRLITIDFVGEYYPNFADEATTGVGRSQRGFIKSGHINSNPNTGPSIMSTFLEAMGYYNGRNYIHVHIEDLIFRTETIQGGININNYMSGIDFRNLTQFTYNNIKVECSTPISDSVKQLGSYGIIMPEFNNKVQLGDGNAYIAGFKNGIMIGEHFRANRLIILGCENAILFPDSVSSFHSASIAHLNIESCKNNILMQNSNQVLNIFNYDTEHFYDGDNWYAFENDIKKTGGTGVVNIFNAQVVRSLQGNVNEFITSGNPNYKILTGVGAN